MIRFLVPVLGFVAIGAGVGFDYLSQRKNAGETLSVSAYFETVTQRHSQYKASLVRHDLAAYMPAPSGWTKRDYTEADKARLMPAPSATTATPENGEDPNRSLPSNGDAQTQRAHHIQGMKTYLAAYEKGDALVAVYAQFLPEHLLEGASGRALDEVARLQQLSDPERFSQFATVQGVPFVVDQSFEGPSRRINATLAQQVRVFVQAIGTDEEIFQVLSRFDFANLNLMVKEPVDYVGQPESKTVLASAQDPDLVAPEAASLAEEEGGEPGMLKGFLASLIGGAGPGQAELAEVDQSDLTRTVTCETNHLGKRCVITYE